MRRASGLSWVLARTGSSVRIAGPAHPQSSSFLRAEYITSSGPSTGNILQPLGSAKSPALQECKILDSNSSIKINRILIGNGRSASKTLYHLSSLNTFYRNHSVIYIYLLAFSQELCCLFTKGLTDRLVSLINTLYAWSLGVRFAPEISTCDHCLEV